MKVYVGRSRASDADVADLCAAASLRLNAITRSMHQTDAQPRSGRHHRLSPEERERRRADRLDRQRKRRLQKDTLAEMAEQRAARKRQRDEDRWWKTRIRVKVPKDQRSKVTRTGGASLYRQRNRFERVMLPQWRGTNFEQSTLVWRIKSRSLGGRGLNRYRRRECSRFARYMINIVALEAAPDEAILTSIVSPDVPRGSDGFAREMVTFLDAAEDLEARIDASGQLYKSIIIPLPHDIGFDRRREIAQSYARQFERHNLPYLIAMHAPDPGGDRRNYHLHALVLTRAFEQVGDHEWVFAKTKSRDVFHPAMLKVWRRYTVNLFNHHLAATGSERRYSLRATRPAGEHRGRVRTIDQRQAADTESERVDRTERARDQSEMILVCARTIALVAKRHVETGRTIGQAGRATLRQLKSNLAAVKEMQTVTHDALRYAALLAEGQRLVVAVRKRKEQLARLVRVRNLQHVLATQATAVTIDRRRLDDVQRQVARRLSAELRTMSEALETTRDRAAAASLQAARRGQVDHLRDVIGNMTSEIASSRRRLDVVTGNVQDRVRYLIAHMVKGATRQRAALVSMERSVLRRHASTIRDIVTATIDSVASARIALPRLASSGLKAQAEFVVSAAHAEAGVRQIRSKGPVAAPPAPASLPRSHHDEHIDLPAFDRAVRALPIVAGSMIANSLADLRAAMREGRAALYRRHTGIRIETGDQSVRDTLARLQANPRGTAMLLRIAAPPNACEQIDPDQAIAPSPTTVPSLMPSRPVPQPTSSQLPPAPSQPHGPPRAEPERDVAGVARRDGNER